MPTFKAVVQRHQERKDGKFPISIRVIHNRQVCYLSTGLYCSRSQINKHTFEIKDQFILIRTGQTIRNYESALLEIDTEAMRSMSVHELCAFFRTNAQELDFIRYSQSIVESNPRRYRALRSALRIIQNMGITKLSAADFTSAFLRQFREALEQPISNGTSTRLLSESTKAQYQQHLCMVFRRMQKEYNTEFHKVIVHDPFVNMEKFRPAAPDKRSLSIEQLREFFALRASNTYEQIAIDMVKMSFGMCGINLFDLQRLEWNNYDEQTQRVHFVRHKTEGAAGNRVAISIRIEPEVMEVAQKYLTPRGSKYLFNFGNKEPDIDYSRVVYSRLKTACRKNGIGTLTPYQFRHTWATIARNNCDVSKDDIDLCLAHVGNNPMADVYIRPDYSRIDTANRKVLDYVFGNIQKKD